MPVPPYAQMQASINGGAFATGGLAVTSGQTVQLAGVNTTGWSSAIWEIYYYPAGFNPGGSWVLEADGYTWSNTNAVPSAFSVGSTWGKFLIRLRVNGNPLSKNSDGSPNAAFVSQLTDEVTSLTMVSPHGVRDLGYLESTQFSTRGWTADHESNLRLLETALASCVFRSHLGADSGGTWALIPA